MLFRSPVYKIEDVYHFKKYDSALSPAMKSWLWFQLIALLLFISYLFGNIAAIGSQGMFIYGFFVFTFVYALSELMDNNSYAWVWELLKTMTGFGIIFYSGDWFLTNNYHPMIKNAIATYFLISLIVTFYFCRIGVRKQIEIA